MSDTSALFRGSVPTSTTIYVPVPIRDGTIGIEIGWLDAVSSATITLELTSSDAAYTTAGNAWEWKDSAVSITGPAAAAAGSALVNVENVRQKRARLKIVTAAVSQFDIRDGTGDGFAVGVSG